MKNIKKYLCAIVMMVISMTAFAQEDVFSGDIHIYRVLRIGEITVVSVNRISFIRGSIKPVIVYSIQSYKTGSINHVTRSIE